MSLKIVKNLLEAAMPDPVEYVVTSGQTVTKGNLVHLVAASGTVSPTTAVGARCAYQNAGLLTAAGATTNAIGVAQDTVVGDGVKKVLIQRLLPGDIVTSVYSTGTPQVGDLVQFGGTTDHVFTLKDASTNPCVGQVIAIRNSQTGLDAAGSAAGPVTVQIF